MRAGVYGRQSQGNKKSIADQMVLGHELCLDKGWEERPYSDKVSASWFGTKQRGGWDEVLADLEAGALDVLVLWESSRGDRRNTEWSRMLDTCVDRGVKIHIIEHERTYDPRIARDWETLASEGVKSQAEVLKLSSRVRRGVALAARDGRPAAGPCPYGYRRVYDTATGALVGMEPNPETRFVVTWIFAMVARSMPIGSIVDELNGRGVAPPAGQRWYRQRVRLIALSRTYLGERKHKSEWLPGSWEPLTDPVTFADANRVLNAPGRAKFGQYSRPGKQVHLLTYISTCSKCEGPITARTDAYRCAKGCVHIKREPVDRLIRDLAIARLSSPDAYAALVQPGQAADANLKAYEEEKAALTQRLDEVRLSARKGKTSLESLAVIEGGLTEDIEELTRQIESARTPAELAGWVGPEEDVAARWDAAPVQARRTVLRAIRLRVQLVPSGQNAYSFLTDRVAVSWE